MAGLGAARQGTAGQGSVAAMVFGLVRLQTLLFRGTARQGLAGLGSASRGSVSSDGLRFGSTPNAALSWRGAAGQGAARRGRVSSDGLWFGSTPNAALFMARLGAARLGLAWRGWAGLGKARIFYLEET